MTRRCIVAHGAPMLHGYLIVVLARELEGPDPMEIFVDRRRAAPAPGGAPLGEERRTHSAVEAALQTHGFVILDENGNVATPQTPPASREAALLWKSAAGWAGERSRSLWQARPATRTVVKLAGVLMALAVSAGLVAAQYSIRTDRTVVLPGEESRMASAPTPTAMVTSPPTVDRPPAPVVALPEPEASSPALVATTPTPARVASAPADRPPAAAEPRMRRTPAAAPPNPTPQPSATSRAQASRPAVASVPIRPRGSAPASEGPTAPGEAAATAEAPGAPRVVLETDPQGTGNERSITYTARVWDASGDPLANAEVSLHAWMPPDGSNLEARLNSTSTPGTYQGTVEVGVRTPGNLRVGVAHGGKTFEIAPQRLRH
jgi:hypothetical protein